MLTCMQGDTNIAYLHENNVTIWDEWADENGDLGPVYGKQWRAWPTPDGRHIDQITTVLNQLKNDPDSRRIIATTPPTIPPPVVPTIAPDVELPIALRTVMTAFGSPCSRELIAGIERPVS